MQRLNKVRFIFDFIVYFLPLCNLWHSNCVLYCIIIKPKMMKKLIGLVLGMFLTVATFANGVVTYSDAETAEASKNEGVFNFAFDSSFSIEDINKAATYYESYFTVTSVVSNTGASVLIELVDDNELSRRVITRFFVSLDVKEIKVISSVVSIDDFIANYVMK